MSVTHTVNVHLERGEQAGEVSATALSDFVTLSLGRDVDVFLRDPAVIDALEVALAEARALLQQMAAVSA